MATPIVLENGEARAEVHAELGGWLTRYQVHTARHGWVDVLQHDPAVVARYPDRMWAGNPVLFPHVSYNVAKGREGAYELNGTLYESPQHGFARRVPWEITARSTESVTLEVVDSGRTRPSYPFHFSHRLTYRLSGGRLEWEQVVENRDPQPLPFTTGFHPYFALPMRPGGRLEDCFIRLPSGRRYHPVGKAEAFFDEPFAGGDWPAVADVSGTLLLGELAAREVALVDRGAGLTSVLNFAGHPDYRFLALWARSGDPFYCVEPWTALPNSFGRSDGEVTLLPPGGTFRAGFHLELRSWA